MSTVSVVIPAYNEGVRLPPFLAELAQAATTFRGAEVEFIVSDDGSTDANADAERAAVDAAQAQMRSEGVPHRFVFHRNAVNGGKGSAIRGGWSQSTPDAAWLAFLDADGAICASEFFRLCGLLSSASADIVAGSRIKMAGHQISRSFFRHLQGRVFATMVERMFHLGFYDTQCGLKFFRSDILRPVLPLLREEHWVLDIEVMARMAQAGARCQEVPIDWDDKSDSKVRFGVDAVKMFWSLRRIKRRLSAS